MSDEPKPQALTSPIEGLPPAPLYGPTTPDNLVVCYVGEAGRWCVPFTVAGLRAVMTMFENAHYTAHQYTKTEDRVAAVCADVVRLQADLKKAYEEAHKRREWLWKLMQAVSENHQWASSSSDPYEEQLEALLVKMKLLGARADAADRALLEWKREQEAKP